MTGPIPHPRSTSIGDLAYASGNKVTGVAPRLGQSAFDRQEGGDHYKKYPVPLAEFVHKNNIPYLEASVIYYVTRWRDKNGLADIDKAIHTLQLLKELEERQ